MKRFTNLTSLAGTFGYACGAPTSPSALVRALALPGGSAITDAVGRLTDTILRNVAGNHLNLPTYLYDLGLTHGRGLTRGLLGLRAVTGQLRPASPPRQRQVNQSGGGSVTRVGAAAQLGIQPLPRRALRLVGAQVRNVFG
jgi:hypothetical protein